MKIKVKAAPRPRNPLVAAAGLASTACSSGWRGV